MRDRRDIEPRLAGYVDRMMRIRTLSSPQLDDVSTADAYAAVLLRNFREIGELANENRTLIAELIDPFLKSVDKLDPAAIEAVQRFNESLLDAVDAETLDLPIATLLSDRLTRDAADKDDERYFIHQLDKEIENSYLLANMTQRITVAPGINQSFKIREHAALESLLDYLEPEAFLALDEECREIVMVNARYGASVYDCADVLPREDCEAEIALLERALAMAKDPFYRDALPGYDWDYHVFRTLEYLAETDVRAAGEEAKRKVASYALDYERLWRERPDLYGELRTEGEILQRVNTARYRAEVITADEYRELCWQLFAEGDAHDYSSTGIDTNIDAPLGYLATLEPEHLSEEQRARVGQIYRSVLAYTYHTPKMGLLSATLEAYAQIIAEFIELPEGVSFEDMCLRSMAALHPPTYVHSRMVASLTRCLVGHLLRVRPELFVGICGCPDAASVPEYAGRIERFAYQAALLHDVGKIIVIDTIFIYGRNLLDFEFEIIRQHPSMGAELLERHASTREFADIARGHHLWYDGSRGYPEEFDTAASPLKTIIDVVACADCLDAATDIVGRSYNRGKTLEEFEAELAEGAGTRYAPYLPELFATLEIRADISYLLTEGRARVYQETYQLLRSVHESAEE